MKKYIERKIKWKKQDVYEYGGDSEHAGSFENPDFVEIQRASLSDCVIAKQAETGHWYWFKEDDTLLPWMYLKGEEDAYEVHENGRILFMSMKFAGPFASEKGAKKFGENYAREFAYRANESRRRGKFAEEARRAIEIILSGNSSD